MRRMLVLFLLTIVTVAVFAASTLVSRTSELVLQGDRSFLATQAAPEAYKKLEQQPWQFTFEQLVPEDERLLRRALAEGDPVLLQTLLVSSDPEIASYAALVLGRIFIDAAVSQQNPEFVQTALALFMQAARLNEENEDAKYNLELLFVLLQANPQFPNPGNDSGDEGDTGANGGDKGAGRGPLGGGY